MAERRVCAHSPADMTDRFGDVLWCRWCGPIDAKTRRPLPGAGLERLGDRLGRLLARRRRRASVR